MAIRNAARAGRSDKGLTRHGESRRGQILEAALATMSRKGFERTSIADIAGRARVSRATVYQHFSDKRDVLVALAHRVTFRVIEAASAWPPLPEPAASKDPSEREIELRRMIEERLLAVLRTVAANADATRLIIRLTRGNDTLVDDTMRGMDQFVVQAITKDIETAQRYGWARHCDAPLVARFLLGGIERIVICALDHDEELDPEALSAEIGAFVFASLLSRAYFDAHGVRRAD